ncbi:peptidase inhibitor family I36 protein [Streptomyces smyrnaeus]|uniref:peptidase inhibitor family I36 protein n=1 Tax=Streptomyces TaxID=1883 RepID=UPI000C18929D|nr:MULTISPECIES: peptidase inhibitor family I36 protein [unclassified Streptomyces]MBQ0863289.1 peptidase inhibitor family I36 protein [Streptomyces sp. RK75]MBQ1123357.1 peptidase inhibitor family I36 protein [Streptomyces sp. B15]MBQ1157746.1 peptidase inhibitor family I36 protein [Streptomyces sp. A73]
MKGMLGRGPKTAAGILAATALAVSVTAAAQPAGARSQHGSQQRAVQNAAPKAAVEGAALQRAGKGDAGPRLGKCGPGELCLWERPKFKGKPRVHELSGIDIESCTPLRGGASATSAANRTGRPVTLYQSAECAETAEFNTHPSGSWTPELPYRARAFKVWEH